MSENTPKVSIVIPVYNVEKYLQTCINSLLEQSLKDIELIFVNDASPDHSLEILQKNAKKNPGKMKIINSEKNLCQGGARNLGIKAANGKYIGFVDSDDLINPNMYDVLYKKITTADADVAFIQYTSIPEDFESSEKMRGGAIPLIQWNEKILALDSLELDDKGRMNLMSYPIGGIVCGLWKKDIIIENKIFFPENLKYEDNYWGSLIKCYITKVTFIPSIMYYYRCNPNSTTHSQNKAYHLDRIVIEKRLLEDVQKRKLFKRYHAAWEYMFTFRFAFSSYFLFLNTFDIIPVKTMVSLMEDLRSIFPQWKKNRYYQELTSNDIKRKHKIVARFPKAYVILHIIKKHSRKYIH